MWFLLLRPFLRKVLKGKPKGKPVLVRVVCVSGKPTCWVGFKGNPTGNPHFCWSSYFAPHLHELDSKIQDPERGSGRCWGYQKIFRAGRSVFGSEVWGWLLPTFTALPKAKTSSVAQARLCGFDVCPTPFNSLWGNDPTPFFVVSLGSFGFIPTFPTRHQQERQCLAQGVPWTCPCKPRFPFLKWQCSEWIR